MMHSDLVDVLTISDVARAVNRCVDTLREWDRTGKFPAAMRTPMGMRIYRRSDVDRLKAELDAREHAHVG